MFLLGDAAVVTKSLKAFYLQNSLRIVSHASFVVHTLYFQINKFIVVLEVEALQERACA